MTSITNLRNILKIKYPYTDEFSPFCESIYFNFILGVPNITFSGKRVSPQVGEKLQVFYSANHTISALDGASSTTISVPHESILVEGAAGFASQIRAAQMAESFASSITALVSQAAYYLGNFRSALNLLKIEVSYPYSQIGFDVDPDVLFPYGNRSNSQGT